MHEIPWSIRFAPDALRDKFRIPRGEAAVFDEAVALLFKNSKPPSFEPLEGLPNTYHYTYNGYRIVYQVLTDIRTNRVVLFHPVERI